MDQWREYWFDSLTDSHSVPRLMIACISITSWTGYTPWFVSAALYIAYCPQLRAFLALYDLTRHFLFPLRCTCLEEKQALWEMLWEGSFCPIFQQARLAQSKNKSLKGQMESIPSVLKASFDDTEYGGVVCFYLLFLITCALQCWCWRGNIYIILGQMRGCA